MKELIFCLFVFGCFACQYDTSPEGEEKGIIPVLLKKEKKFWEEPYDTVQYQKDYKNLLENIYQERKALADNSTISLNDKRKAAKKLFISTLTDSIFQYWYGTRWDYNGYTNEPRKGLVACGYFVSTTLKHLGLNINRFKVAQKASADIIKDICLPESIKWKTKYEDLEAHLKKEPDDGLYILGLSNHVGFILRKDKKNYFIDANFLDDAIVMRRPLKADDPVMYSEVFVIGSVTDNQWLLDDWLKRA